MNGERTEKAPPDTPPAASTAGTISEFPFASGSYSYTPSALLTLNNFNFGSTMTFNTELSSTDLATFSFTNGGIASSSWDDVTGTFTITAIPEPSTYLVAVGLIGLMLWPLRRRAAAVAKRF